MIWFNLALILGFSLLLIKSTDIITESLKELAKITRLGQFAITSLLLAFATSIPELVVGITAAIEGRPSLSLGVILGSNIANLSIVIGGAALIGGTLSVSGDFYKFDIFGVFLAGVLPLILMMDRILSRTDGLILLLIYGFYNYSLLKYQPKNPDEFSGRFKLRFINRAFVGGKMNRWLAWLCLGTALLIFSADTIVKISINLAQILSVPEFFIGVFIIAIGATLPELSFGIRAIRKKQAAMILGNLTGSIVVNSTLILGVVSLIEPIKLANGLNAYLLAAAAFGVMFILFWQFVKSKKKLERWEGLALIAAYAVFALLEWGK